MKKWNYIFGILLLLLILVWSLVASESDKNMHLIACDVGQGDAILVTQGSTQILVDGGQGKRVVDCLSEYIPFSDRKIELVIVTHPQVDHFGGIIDVLDSYQVESIMIPNIISSSKEYQLLGKSITESQVRIIDPSKIEEISLGLIHLEIVHPDSAYFASNASDLVDLSAENVLGSMTTDNDPNDFSIVANLRLGEFDAIFTGDIGPAVIDDVISTGELVDVEYIKVPHHGSKNGLTRELLESVSPEIAVISSGKDNRYGHPHKEIIDLLSEYGVKVLRTDELGSIEVVTDGEKYWIEK